MWRSRLAVLGLVLAGFLSQGNNGCSNLVFLVPFDGMLWEQGDVEVQLQLPPLGNAATLLVELDGVDVTGDLVVAGSLATGSVAVSGVGTHVLEASVETLTGTTSSMRQFEVLDLAVQSNGVVADSSKCDVLNQAACILPYPSSRFQVPDPTSVHTGLRNELPGGADCPTCLPQPNGPVIDPAPYNELDGFAPSAPIMMHFPGGVDIEASTAPRLLPPECCGQPAGPPWIETRSSDDRSRESDSPTLLIDTVTGEQILHFVETDVRAEGTPARQVMFMRPGVILEPGRRYIVAVRNLVAPGGGPVLPEDAFRVLRDDIATGIDAIESRRAYFESEIFTPLANLGIPRANLTLAFDFTTQSQNQLTHQMLTMRDSAFTWLDAQVGETFTVESVQDDSADCLLANPPPLGKIIRGKFQSPLFLDGDLVQTSVQFMNVDADDNPVQNGIHMADYTIGIPCTLFQAEPPEDPARPLILGHGIFGRGEGMVTGIPSLLESVPGTTFHYVAGATDWRGLSGFEAPNLGAGDFGWVANFVLGVGNNQLNNFPAFPDRLRQGMLNTLVLARMMKQGLFNSNANFQAGGVGVFPGQSEEMYYYGISLGGVMGSFFSMVTPDVQKFGLDVPLINFSMALQRSTQFSVFELVLSSQNLTDPMDVAVGLALFHDLWVSAEPAGFVELLTPDPALGPQDGKQLLYEVAWLDKQVSNQVTEIAARSLGLKNLQGASIVQGMQDIPDDPGPIASGMVMWDTGSFDILDPNQYSAVNSPIPLLANQIPSGVCDPHGQRPAIPDGITMLLNFLQPGGMIANTCTGLCDALDPGEKNPGIPAECDPFVP